MSKIFHCNNNILSGSVPKTLLLLGIPVILCSFIQQIYSMTNLFITSHILGSDALAIIGGSCDMLITLFTSIVTGMISAAIVLCGQHFGSGNDQEVICCIENSCFCSIGISVLVILFYMIFADNLLIISNCPNELISDSALYLRLYSLGFIPYFLFQLLIGCLRGIGQTKKPTQLIILSFAINGILDIIFLGILQLNVYCIAYSYIITNSICCLLTYISVKSYYPVKLNRQRLNLKQIFKILKLGIPCSLTSVTFALSNIYLQSYINLLGTTFISSYSINVKVENFYWFTLNSIALACTTFISQNFGAKKYNRITEGFKWSLLFAGIFTVFISIFIYTMCPFLSNLLSNESDIVNTTIFIMKYMSRFYLTYFVIDIIAATLKAIGYAKECTLVIITFTCLSRILRLITLDDITPINVLSVFPISWSLTSIALILTYCFYRNKYNYSTKI